MSPAPATATAPTATAAPPASDALPAAPPHPAVALYLRTLRLALTGLAHEHSFRYENGIDAATRTALVAQGLELIRRSSNDRLMREEGLDWPLVGETMIGMRRLEHLQWCVEEVLSRGVPGDLIETGVWRGGASILMRGVLAAHAVEGRSVYVCDSFEGLPPPDVARYPADAGDEHYTQDFLAVSLDDVRANFERYGLLDSQVRFLKGWFKDTLPGVADRAWSIVRLDGDMYESTMDGLVNLYPGLAPGGFLIVDDWNAVPACKQAVHDYRAKHSITALIEPIDRIGAYWRKPA